MFYNYKTIQIKEEIIGVIIFILGAFIFNYACLESFHLNEDIKKSDLHNDLHN